MTDKDERRKLRNRESAKKSYYNKKQDREDLEKRKTEEENRQMALHTQIAKLQKYRSLLQNVHQSIQHSDQCKAQRLMFRQPCESQSSSCFAQPQSVSLPQQSVCLPQPVTQSGLQYPEPEPLVPRARTSGQPQTSPVYPAYPSQPLISSDGPKQSAMQMQLPTFLEAQSSASAPQSQTFQSNNRSHFPSQTLSGSMMDACQSQPQPSREAQFSTYTMTHHQGLSVSQPVGRHPQRTTTAGPMAQAYDSSHHQMSSPFPNLPGSTVVTNHSSFQPQSHHRHLGNDGRVITSTCVTTDGLTSTDSLALFSQNQQQVREPPRPVLPNKLSFESSDRSADVCTRDASRVGNTGQGFTGYVITSPGDAGLLTDVSMQDVNYVSTETSSTQAYVAHSQTVLPKSQQSEILFPNGSTYCMKPTHNTHNADKSGSINVAPQAMEESGAATATVTIEPKVNNQSFPSFSGNLGDGPVRGYHTVTKSSMPCQSSADQSQVASHYANQGIPSVSPSVRLQNLAPRTFSNQPGSVGTSVSSPSVQFSNEEQLLLSNGKLTKLFQILDENGITNDTVQLSDTKHNDTAEENMCIDKTKYFEEVMEQHESLGCPFDGNPDLELHPSIQSILLESNQPLVGASNPHRFHEQEKQLPVSGEVHQSPNHCFTLDDVNVRLKGGYEEQTAQCGGHNSVHMK